MKNETLPEDGWVWTETYQSRLICFLNYLQYDEFSVWTFYVISAWAGTFILYMKQLNLAE
jgi:hypothetical protein